MIFRMTWRNLRNYNTFLEERRRQFRHDEYILFQPRIFNLPKRLKGQKFRNRSCRSSSGSSYIETKKEKRAVGLD